MSFIKAEITYPEGPQTFKAECISGQVTVQKADDYQIGGREETEVIIDITNKRPGPNKKIKLTFEEKFLSKLIESARELEKIEPEKSFTSNGITYSLYPKNNGISFDLTNS